eukprot:NODE_901_length_1566_cov_81.738707_g890_i0.p1 GENE.NODE_901_length_1566_cov_81.738707_g890_i0~~NODE_901_length_1566_cov_81.738707_g890_i0.p1  ORF type:complete len:410 (-),score=57.02 NODE_901_length_1566_cov_81.738707_g890_i0:127-1356(-)
MGAHGSDSEDDYAPAFIDVESGEGVVVEDSGAPISDSEDEAEQPLEPQTSDPGQETEPVEPQLPREPDSVAVFPGHCSPVHALAVHPSKPLVVTGGEDDMAYLWNWQDTTAVKDLKAHTDTVISAAFTCDGKVVVTGGMDGNVCLWNVEDATLMHTLCELGEAVEWVLTHPKGPVLFAGSESTMSAMWNVKGDLMNMFPGHTDRVSCGMLSLDGTQLITGSADGSVKVWNPKTGEAVQSFDRAQHHTLPAEEVTCIAQSPANADVAVVGYMDGSVVLLAYRAGKVTCVLKQHEESVEGIATSGLPFSLVATGDSAGVLCVWDMGTQAIRYKQQIADGITKVICFQDQVVCSTMDGRLVIRDIRATSEQSKALYSRTRDPIQNVIVDPSMEVLLTAGDDHTAQVFPVPKE